MRKINYFSKNTFRTFIGVLSLTIFCHSNTYSQNLIQNGSFEDYTTCPDAPSQLDLCENWFSALEFTTPDYYNACSQSGCGVGVPQNAFSSNLNAPSGDGYAGLITISTSVGEEDPGSREYLSIELNDPLESGKIYNLTCSVALAPVSTHSTKLQINFSNLPLESPNFSSILLEQPTISLPPFLDTTWVEINTQFVADSNYKFLTIGYFDDYEEADLTDVTFPTPKCISQFDDAIYVYYLIDDVSIIEENSTPDLCVLDEEKPGLQINKLSNDLYDIMITYKDSNMSLEDIGYDEIVEIIACHKVCRDLTFDVSNFSFIDHCDMMDDLSRGTHFDVPAAANYDAMKYYTCLEEIRYFSEFIVRMTVEECVKI